MTYVPIVVTTPPPSPRTRELAELLGKVLDEYTKAHPAVTKAEIRAAINMAQATTGPDNTKLALGLSVGLGLVVLFLGLGLFYFRSVGEVEIGPILPMIIMALIALIGVAVLVMKAQSR